MTNGRNLEKKNPDKITFENIFFKIEDMYTKVVALWNEDKLESLLTSIKKGIFVT